MDVNNSNNGKNNNLRQIDGKNKEMSGVVSGVSGVVSREAHYARLLQSFAERLRLARLRLKLSQQALADKIGVNVNTVKGFEKGKPPRLDILLLIVDVLGTPIEELVYGRTPCTLACSDAADESINNEFEYKIKQLSEAVDELSKAIRNRFGKGISRRGE